MVRDGYLYALGMLVAAFVAGYFWLPLVVGPLLLAGFFLWFFRDPERQVPADPGAVVSPADGKVTTVAELQTGTERKQRISIFLNVFDVHVNRSPAEGVVRSVHYQRGRFGNAMAAGSSEDNEQNVVVLESEGRTVVFKQIAGLLARRIVFTKQVGEHVGRGERIGLMKFSSRMDVILDLDAEVLVNPGDRVVGGETIIARFAEPLGVRTASLRDLERQRKRQP